MDFMWAADGAAHAGAARRRRERRLRAYLRYARMSVAMALAEATHHTHPKGQKTARARGEERDELYDAKGLMTPLPSWPTPLVEVRPQRRVLRHAVEGLGEFAPMVQILDAPVPPMVDYVAEALRLLDRPIAEQVIEVPTVSCSPCPSRSQVPVPLTAEQLVEVPTILTPTRIALRIAEQIVDIPPSACAVSGSLQGFPPEQSSAQRTASQIADIPVPGRGVFDSPQGSLPEQSTAKRTASQIVDILVPGLGGSSGSLPEQSTAKRTASQIADIPVPGRGSSGCLLGSLPEQRTTALHVALERISERIEQIDAGGDFPSRRAGPRVVRPRQRSAAAGAEQLADIVSHGPDHVDEHLPESAEWVQSSDPNGKTFFWKRRTRVSQWKPPPGIRVVWVAVKPEEGAVYYWHKETRASTYDLPPLPPE